MKKKAVLLFLALVGALAVHAEDAYTYLTFETTDGARVSVPVASLTLTISGHTLTAGTQSFTLSNLTKMYFSTGDETTGVETMDNGQWTMDNGQFYGNLRPAGPQGVEGADAEGRIYREDKTEDL